MPEIADQAVGDVDRRRRDAAQREAERDPGRGPFEPRARGGQRSAVEPGTAGQRGERERGIAERAGNVDVVARLRARRG